MESLGGVFFDEECESLRKLFSFEDVFDFNGENGFAFESPSTFWQAMEASLSVTHDNEDNNQIMHSDDFMNFLVTDQKDYYCDNNSSSPSPVDNNNAEEKALLVVGNPRKRTRKSRDGQKGKRNANSKAKKDNEEKDETNNTISQKNLLQSSSCSTSSSEDDSTTTNNNNLSLNGKSRASRGAATDPQSIYARRRRERINERLRILQSLVPNGTKVDISTMLEEAVQYVKFLQLQIKLLSSDDMWMYAPIAYNGMDIGLYQKMLPSL